MTSSKMAIKFLMQSHGTLKLNLNDWMFKIQTRQTRKLNLYPLSPVLVLEPGCYHMAADSHKGVVDTK